MALQILGTGPKPEEVAEKLRGSIEQAIAGARCRSLSSDCEVEIRRDSDGDFELDDEPAVVVQALTAADATVQSVNLTVDPSDRIAFTYSPRNGGFPNVRVAHDRDGDGLFTGTNELLALDGVNFGDVTRLAVDASSRVAVIHTDTFDVDVKVYYDRSGDGDYDDTVGGNPESFVPFSGGPSLAMTGRV